MLLLLLVPCGVMPPAFALRMYKCGSWCMVWPGPRIPPDRPQRDGSGSGMVQELFERRIDVAAPRSRLSMSESREYGTAAGDELGSSVFSLPSSWGPDSVLPCSLSSLKFDTAVGEC